jgi:hypothetical protein
MATISLGHSQEITSNISISRKSKVELLVENSLIKNINSYKSTTPNQKQLFRIVKDFLFLLEGQNKKMS